MGTTLYTAILLTVLLKAALLTNLWTKPAWIAIPGSFLFWIVFFPIYGTVAPLLGVSTEYRGLTAMLYGSSVFWLTVIILPAICIVRDYAWKFAKRMYFAKPYHYIQEIQKFNIPDYRPRMERFRKAVHKVRMIQRLKRNRGYAFSQNDGGQEKLIRAYDTTLEKPRG
jgi:phospholipid-transporting ATPase